MNVIALFSFPQECENSSLRLINCFDGQVVLFINLSPQRDPYEEVVHREILSEKGTFYDQCVKQRFEVGDKDCHFFSLRGATIDEERTKSLHSNPDAFWKEYKKEELTIIGVQDIKTLSFDSEEQKKFLQGKEVHLWKYTVAKADTTVEYVYHPEWDTVYQEILQKCGIKCSYDERRDCLVFAERIAEAMGYNLLNTLWG